MRKCIAFLLIAFISVCFSSAAAASEAVQLIHNSDFSILSIEQPLPAGWYYDAWSENEANAFTSITPEGETVLELQNIWENDARICQRISVLPNKAYELSCEISTENITGAYGASLSVLDTYSASEQIYGTTGWQRVRLTGVTGPKQTELVFALRIGSYGALSQGNAQFKNPSMVELSAIPADALSFEPLKYESTPSEAGSAPNWALILIMTGLVAGCFIFIYKRLLGERSALDDEKPQAHTIMLLLGLAFFLRAALSVIFVGHSTDILCFSAWAQAMAEYGPSGFYSSGIFADYPPGYMYVLWAIGALQKLFGLASGSALSVLLIKLTAIIADLALAYLVYRFALNHGAKGIQATILFMIAAFHPAVAFISGGWGQIDSILTLCLFASIWLYTLGRKISAGMVFGLAILIKPQALMLGPILAVAYLYDVLQERTKKALIQTLIAVLAAFAVIILPSLPFSKGQAPNWLFDKYFSTATSYPFASIEAFNFAALAGGNWAPVESVPFLFSYKIWGTIGLAVSVVYSCVLYVAANRKDGKGSLFLCSAYLLTGLFMLGQFMHERYLFPALLLLFIACICYNERRLYLSFFYLSTGFFLNILCAFVIVDYPASRAGAYETITFIGSLIMAAGFLYLTYVCTDIIIKNRSYAAAAKISPQDLTPTAGFTLISNFESKLSFMKRDRLYCCCLTFIYAFIALLNLGSFSAPESEYSSTTAGQTAVLAFDEEVQLSEFWVFGGIAEGTLLVEADDGEQLVYEQSYDDMFRWLRVKADIRTLEVKLITYSGDPRIREIAFFNEFGEYVKASPKDAASSKLVDEQAVLPARPSYYNGMYFDELYHARTAYEHLKGLEPYENSHPPLGKIFIMLGIALFGMNPFGWRIIGTLFGIGMVPIIYAFGKRLFKKPEYALLCTVLFTFDFMHFTQTRIATIDVYAVFFIILMYYYMYQYYCMNFYVDGLKATLKPLGLAGLFFALGAATKWLCIYAGLGLAVLLLLSLLKRYSEYKKAVANEAYRESVQHFMRNTVFTLLWCCVFFIAVPVVLYLASYLPYHLSNMHYGLQEIWGFQKFMFTYHSGLQSTHPFQSSWWSWPFTLRPMWYYWGESASSGYVSTLSASGNPATWWLCTIGALTLAVTFLLGFRKHEPGMTVAFVGILSNYLPWVLVPRCTFIYHFFATVPFTILCSVYVLSDLENQNKRVGWVKWAWMALCVVLFILFYPGISGLEVQRTYAEFLNKLPGGNMIYFLELI